MSNQKIVIGKMNLFATPNSIKDIEDWIERHCPEERAHLYTAMYMTWNYLSEVVKQAQEFGENNGTNSTN